MTTPPYLRTDPPESAHTPQLFHPIEPLGPSLQISTSPTNQSTTTSLQPLPPRKHRSQARNASKDGRSPKRRPDTAIINLSRSGLDIGRKSINGGYGVSDLGDNLAKRAEL